MRTIRVTCDVCANKVDDFNGGVIVSMFGDTLRHDACSPKCVVATLKRVAAEIEKKGDAITAENAAFRKEHPEAKPTGNGAIDWDTKKWGTSSQRELPESQLSPPVSVPDSVSVIPQGWAPQGCAACDTGAPFNAETAFKHTGEGTACKGMKQGPCTCSPEHWKMETPPDVVCLKCGNMWVAKLHPENHIPPPGAKKRGRPAGSKNRPPEVAREEMERLRAKREEEARLPPVVFPAPAQATVTQAAPTGPLFASPADIVSTGPKVAHPIDDARRRTDQPPNWCACGKPRVWTGLRQWECEEHGPHGMPLAVKEGQPGENLSKLLTDAAVKGVILNLVDVAGWPVLKRDVLRAWVEQGGDRPEFLGPESIVVPKNQPEPAKSRFTF
jgi:hypothetical protein